MDKKGEVLAGPTWVLLSSNSFSICFGKNLATVKNKFTEQPIVCLTTRKLVPVLFQCKFNVIIRSILITAFLQPTNAVGRDLAYSPSFAQDYE